MMIRDNIIYGLYAVMLIIGMSACEDVIQIETEPTDPLVVVDAWVTNEARDQVIKLSLSQPYFDANLATPITGATVTVASSNSELFNFIATEPGTYTWSAGLDSLGAVGTDFDLMINWNGRTLNATSTANRVPPIDSISQEFEEESIRGPEGVRTNFFARDPLGFGDTYWIKTYKNGEYLNKPDELNIAYDAGFDAGGQVDGLIFIPPIREATNPVSDDDDEDLPPWATGDQIRVEIHSISNAAFAFLETARDQITNGDNGLFSIPLANTKGNVVSQDAEDTVLGIFNVAAVSRIEEVIQ